MKPSKKLLLLSAACVCLLLKPSLAKAASLSDAVRDQLIPGSGSSYGAMTQGIADIDTFNPTYDYYLGEHYAAAVGGRSVKLLQPASGYQGTYASKVSLSSARSTYQTQQVSQLVNPVSNAVVTQSPSMYNNYQLYRTLNDKMLFAHEGQRGVSQSDLQAANVLIENTAKSLGTFGLVQAVSFNLPGHADMGEVVTAGEFSSTVAPITPDAITEIVDRVTPDPPEPQPTPDSTPQGASTPKPGDGDQPNIRTWEEKTHPIIIG